MIKAIRAECIKLRYMPLISLSIFTIGMITMIITSAHLLDINSVIVIGKNPWNRMLDAGSAMFSVFMINPFVILLVSAAVFLEFQNKTWKYQYTIPSSRLLVYFSKLFSLLMYLGLLLLILTIAFFACSYLLEFLRPEFGFSYWIPDIFHLLDRWAHIFISCLGVLGIQFFLSHRFKGFLVPASFGTLAFIVGFIFGTINKSYAHYYPYSYPMVVKDFSMFKIDKIGIVEHGWINSIEIYSIAIFLFFIGLGAVLELNKRIS